MHNAFTQNVPCSFYHLKTPCLTKTKQKSCIINLKKILCKEHYVKHNKFLKNSLQGTLCKMASAETVVEEWRSNTEFRQDAVQKAD
jgi:hypothetical protein